MSDMKKAEYFQYLKDLRDGGEVNMYGAAPLLADEFGLEIKEARMALKEFCKEMSNES